MTESRMTVDERLVLRGDRDPRLRATTATVAILAGRPDVETVREALERATRVVPRLRQRAVQPSVPTTEPRWVTDPDFDLEHHWHRLALPQGSDWTDFLALVESILETPFDPARPQWSVTLVEGLDSGRSAVVAALSPVVREGGHPLDLLGRLGDALSGATMGARPMPPQPVPTDLDPSDLAKRGLRELPERALGLAMGSTREAFDLTLALGADPQRAVGKAVELLHAVGTRAGRTAGPLGSPALSGRGASRRLVTLDVAAARVGSLRSGPLGGVHQGALTAALEYYHRAVGLADTPVAIVVASHPSGVRSALDPGSREAASILSGVGALIPTAALDLVRGPVRVADVVAVTLGDRSALASIGGAALEAEYAVAPVPGNAVTSVVVQRGGALHVAVRFDPAAIRDVDAFVRALEAGWESVVPTPTATTTPKASAKRAARKTAKAGTKAPVSTSARTAPKATAKASVRTAAKTATKATPKSQVKTAAKTARTSAPRPAATKAAARGRKTSA